MSRGISKIQKGLFACLLRIGKPVTFDELCRTSLKWGGFDPNTDRFKQSKLRSLRRSLRGQIRDGAIITLGGGGRADPFRYFPHPMILAISGRNDLIEAIEKAPGGLEALAGAYQAIGERARRVASLGPWRLPLACTPAGAPLI